MFISDISLNISNLKRWNPDNPKGSFSLQGVFEEIQRLNLKCLSIEYAMEVGKEIYQLGILNVEENGYLWDSLRGDEEGTNWVPYMSFLGGEVKIYWAYLVYEDEMFISINQLDRKNITLFY